MPSDIQRSMTTNENSNISKSKSNREKKPKVHKKLNLPYIITNISPNEDLIPISPVFSCCDEENSPRLLIYYFTKHTHYIISINKIND